MRIAARAALAALEREAVVRDERQANEAAKSAGTARARATALRSEIERLADAIATVGVSPALADRLRRAEAELDLLDRAKTHANITPLRSAIRARVRALVADLSGSLKQDM